MEIATNSHWTNLGEILQCSFIMGNMGNKEGGELHLVGNVDLQIDLGVTPILTFYHTCHIEYIYEYIRMYTYIDIVVYQIFLSITSIILVVDRNGPPLIVDPFQNFHNAIDKYLTMHHFATETYTHLHISVTKRCIEGYGTSRLWDLCNWSRGLLWQLLTLSEMWNKSEKYEVRTAWLMVKGTGNLF